MSPISGVFFENIQTGIYISFIGGTFRILLNSESIKRQITVSNSNGQIELKPFIDVSLSFDFFIS